MSVPYRRNDSWSIFFRRRRRHRFCTCCHRRRRTLFLLDNDQNSNDEGTILGIKLAILTFKNEAMRSNAGMCDADCSHEASRRFQDR